MLDQLSRMSTMRFMFEPRQIHHIERLSASLHPSPVPFFVLLQPHICDASLRTSVLKASHVLTQPLGPRHSLFTSHPSLGRDANHNTTTFAMNQLDRAPCDDPHQIKIDPQFLLRGLSLIANSHSKGAHANTPRPAATHLPTHLLNAKASPPSPNNPISCR
ncbi:hypothetical protein PDE_01633 [Penicillium oxalicum 114-2]|uniref:Uncharacterized protein n=1 Tax=Penicillium oxalicum (strain 114-2 / CGMCC 5302) TaxID=933388 RepID=S7Z7X6_PENO1|nr:hypothetical protein PDE_01633 [Penicillium oxalicum 114-2]